MPTWPAAPVDVRHYFPSLPAQLHLDAAFPLPLRLNHFQSKTCEGGAGAPRSGDGMAGVAGHSPISPALRARRTPARACGPPTRRPRADWNVTVDGVHGTVQLYANSPDRAAALAGALASLRIWAANCLSYSPRIGACRLPGVSAARRLPAS